LLRLRNTRAPLRKTRGMGRVILHTDRARFVRVVCHPEDRAAPPLASVVFRSVPSQKMRTLPADRVRELNIVLIRDDAVLIAGLDW